MHILNPKLDLLLLFKFFKDPFDNNTICTDGFIQLQIRFIIIIIIITWKIKPCSREDDHQELYKHRWISFLFCNKESLAWRKTDNSVILDQIFLILLWF